MNTSLKYNSATRILVLLESIAPINPNTQTTMAWAKVFGLNVDDSRRAYVVAQRLQVIYEELVELQRKLEEEGHATPDLYRDGLANARAGFSPFHLQQPFSTPQGLLGVGTTQSFKVMSAFLREQDYSAGEEEILEMHRLINDLQSLVSESKLSASLVSMFRAHLELLRRALMDYPISGPRAFRDALKHMRPDLLEHREELLQNKEVPEVSVFEKIWEGAVRLGAPAGIINDIYGVAQIASTAVPLAIAYAAGV